MLERYRGEASTIPIPVRARDEHRGCAVELPLTIPAVVRRAAERFGDIEGIVDGDVRLSFAELATEVDRGGPGDDRVGRRARATGSRSGRRTSGSGRSPRSAVTRSGGDRDPAEHPVQGRRGGLRDRRRAAPTRLFTVTDFLDTNYVDLLAGAPGLRRRSRRSSCCAARARRVRRVGRVPRPRRRDRRGDGRRARRRGAARRPVRHPLHVGHDRAAEGRDAHPLGERPRVRRVVATSSGCAPATATSSSTRSSTRSG